MQYKVEFEPWLGTPFFRGLSHGSENLQSHGSGTPFFRFEPWLGTPFLGGLSHGSGPLFWGGLSHGLGAPFFGV